MQFNATFLTNDEITGLHRAIVKTLFEVGVKFMHEEALEIFRKNGANVDGQIVHISEELLEKALKTTPAQFKLKGASADKDLTIGGGDPVFAGASGPIFARRGGVRHPATTTDFIDLLKLTESSSVVNICNYIIVEPQDRPEEKRKLFQVASALKYSTKPLIGITMGKGRTHEAFKLLHEFYGDTEARTIGIISPISPLVYDEGMIQHILDYAQEKQPIMIAACSQPGATSPMTLAGTLVIDTAEVLAGLVLAQLVNPGLGVIMGSTSTACDLRYVAPSIGSPETGLITVAFKELCRFYKVPCRSGGTLSDAKTVDAQCGIEAAMVMMPTILSGVDFILHACGTMDSFNTVCLEKFIMDEDIAGACMRQRKGFVVDDDELALDAITETKPAGSFLMHEHTMEHCHDAFLPALFSREGYAAWEASGKTDLEKRAALALEKRLAAYKAPALSVAQEKLLAKYLDG